MPRPVDDPLLRALLEAEGIAVSVLDGALRVVEANRRFAGLTQHPLEAHEGARLEDLLKGPRGEAAMATVRAVAASREPGHVRLDTLVGDPMLTCAPARDGEGVVMVVVEAAGSSAGNLRDQLEVERALREVVGHLVAARAEDIDRVTDETLAAMGTLVGATRGALVDASAEPAIPSTLRDRMRALGITTPARGKDR